MVWDYDTCLEVATRGVQLAREAGALAVLAVSVNVMAQAVALGGDFGRAKLLVAEADNVTEATGARVAPYGALVLGGLQGRDAHASRLIDATIDEFTAGGQGTAVQYARWTRSVLLNGLGRYREAMAAAKEASDDTPELFVSVWAAIELVEAASRCDDPDLARDALERILAATAVAPTDWALGIAARCRAVLSEGAACDDLYQEAIERLGRTRLRPEWAALTCFTASGSAARTVVSTRVLSCGRPTSCSPRSGWRRSATAPGVSSWPPEGRCGSERSTRVTTSPRRSGTSRGSRATGCRTRRSVRGSS